MARELRECLNSLCGQSYDDKEIIVVDDASTDELLDVLAEYRGRPGSSLIAVSNMTNLGVAASRNVGIRHAGGDIIAFTDADCVADPEWISQLVEACRHEGVSVAGGRILNDPCHNIWELSEKGHNFVASSEGFVTYIQGCNMAFRADVLRSHMFNEEIKYGYEEALICDELLEEGHRIWYTPHAVVYHKHRSNLGGLLKQKYNRGYSSIWYRRKQGKFPMLKRHLLMLLALLISPACALSAWFGCVIALLLAAVLFGLVRDECLYGAKSTREIWMTLPFIAGSELAHFGGAVAGLFAFHIGWPRRRRGRKAPRTRPPGEDRGATSDPHKGGRSIQGVL